MEIIDRNKDITIKNIILLIVIFICVGLAVVELANNISNKVKERNSPVTAESLNHSQPQPQP